MQCLKTNACIRLCYTVQATRQNVENVVAVLYLLCLHSDRTLVTKSGSYTEKNILNVLVSLNKKGGSLQHSHTCKKFTTNTICMIPSIRHWKKWRAIQFNMWNMLRRILKIESSERRPMISVYSIYKILWFDISQQHLYHHCYMLPYQNTRMTMAIFRH